MRWFNKCAAEVVPKPLTEDARSPAEGLVAEPEPQVDAPLETQERGQSDNPPPPSCGVAEFSAGLAAMTARQDELNRLFDDRLRSDQVQADALRHLHDELRAYRDNFIRQAQLGILKEVMHCYDFVGGVRDAGAGSLDHLKDMLVDLLFKYDVEPFRSESDEFDRDSQQCLGAVPTPEPEKDRKVAVRGLVGFRDRDGILRKEQVSVFKFNQPTGG